MNRLAKCTVASLAIVPAMVFAQSSQTIYKFVDENGRVLYANSPIKGGTKLDLEPLTIIPSSPGAAVGQNSAARAMPVAKVISVPSPAYAKAAMPIAYAAAVATTVPTTTISAPIVAPVAPAPVEPPPTMIAALDTGDKTQERAQQRRADVRQRILQSEIQAEEKSLIDAHTALTEEQHRSGDMRAMRASFSATASAASAQKPLISSEVRAEIERHFERVRNLQDEVAMHEGNIAALREEMVTKK